MPSSNPDFEQKSFRIKHDDMFFSRLLSRETSKPNLSFRVYYGDVSGAVPFMWETRPGTPKHHTFYDTSTIPPLTPPPSFYSCNMKKTLNRGSKSKLLHTLLRRINHKKSVLFELSSSSSISSSSSSWSTSSLVSVSDVTMPSFVCGGRRFSKKWIPF